MKARDCGGGVLRVREKTDEALQAQFHFSLSLKHNEASRLSHSIYFNVQSNSISLSFLGSLVSGLICNFNFN